MGPGLDAGDERHETLRQLGSLIAESPHNLVSRADRPVVQEMHIRESARLLPHLAAQPGEAWLDLGTGGGLPGLVLAVLAPEIRWTLLDSTAKKLRAVGEFVRVLGVANVELALGRAEELAHDRTYRGRYDGVVSRAVAALPVLAELTRGFVRPGGRMLAVKGPAWEDELEVARPALSVLRWAHPQVQRVSSTVRPTWVVTMQAEGPPPPGFPRRVGLPQRQPLGSQ